MKIQAFHTQQQEHILEQDLSYAEYLREQNNELSAADINILEKRHRKSSFKSSNHILDHLQISHINH